MTVLSPPSTTIHPARTGPRPMNAEDLWTIPRVGGPEPAPDGRSLVVPVTTYDLEKNEGTTRLWRVPLAGGEPVALTSAEASSSAPALSPDGSKLAFVRKGGKKNKPQLHVMPLDGGEAECVSDLPLGVFDPRWLPDGSGIVFAAQLLKGHLTIEATTKELERREKDPVKAYVTEDRFYRYWDTWLTTGEVPHLFLWNAATRELRDLTPSFDGWFDWMEPGGQYDIAPDGKEIAFAATHYDADKREQRAAIWTVPIAGGEAKCLTPDHPSDDHLPRYTPDGKAIVYGMQHDRAFYADRVRMMRYDRASKQHASLFDWDLSPTHWTFGADGTLWLETERHARVGLFAWKGEGAPKPVSQHGCASSAAALADGRVAYVRQDLANPPEVYVSGADGNATRVTRFTEAAIARFATGEVREMHFEGAKGETVQMFVVLPPGHDPSKKYPLVQVIHGGPHGISPDGFHWRWNGQAFAAPGYIAAMVNFQGSTSWGQDFAQRIQGAWAERPYEDIMRATDVLIESGLVDETRMAAAGGSYGGYMASWIAGHTDRFKCIVNHAGVYNTLSQYASDWTLGRSKAFGGEPWDGLEAINACNPAHFTDGFNTPMLVIHGEKDYRVPVTQGLECYGVLRAKGIPARLVYFPDENHWVLKAKNSMFWYGEVYAWLKRWLG